MAARKRSITFKIFAALVTTSTIALALAGYLFFSRTNTQLLENHRRQFAVFAEILRNDLEAALLFDDQYSSLQILDKVEPLSAIDVAVVESEKGWSKVFNRFNQKTAPLLAECSPGQGYSMFLDNICYTMPLYEGEKRIGALKLYGKTTVISLQSWQSLSRIIIIIFLCLFVSVVLAYFIAGQIGKRILKLSELIESVRAEGDYSLRLENLGNDEIGALGDGFNQLIEQIEEQQNSLFQALTSVEVQEAVIRQLYEIQTEELPVGERILKCMEHFGSSVGYNVAILHFNDIHYRKYNQKWDPDSAGIELEDVEVFLQKTRELGELVINHLTQDDPYDLFQLQKAKLQSASGLLIDVEDCKGVLLFLGRNTITRPTRQILSRNHTQLGKTFEHAIKDVQAREELFEKNRDLEGYAYFACHDLKTPLNGIIALESLISEEVEEEEIELPDLVVEYLNKIGVTARSMRNLVDDLFVFARAGQTVINHEPFSLRSCLDDALNNLETKVAEAEAKIKLPDDLQIIGDKTLITQVAFNLIGNGIKYRKSDTTPIIEIDTEVSEECCIIKVADNGEGIAPEYREQIFQPFKRLHKGNIPGTGIGLALTRKILERHGQTIWVDHSKLGGSTFCFTMPHQGSAGSNVSETMKDEVVNSNLIKRTYRGRPA